MRQLVCTKFKAPTPLNLIWRIIGRSILSSAATATSKDETNLFQNSFVFLSEAPIGSAIYKGVNRAT